jgi:uncharacterized protein
MARLRTVLWQGLISPSLERLILRQTDHGFELSGLILQAHAGRPYVVRYSVEVDAAWTAPSLMLEIEDGESRSLRLASSAGGAWTRDGRALPLPNCVDVDIEWSPSTNTLPLRRLGLSVGQRTSVTAAWVRLPSLEVEPLQQSYERLETSRYRYRAGSFTADLTVDDESLITRYGANWQAVATSAES